MKVKAKKLGFYGNVRQKPGDVFVLKDAKHFSPKWMVEVGEDGKPLKAEAKAEAKPEERHGRRRGHKGEGDEAL